MRIIIINGLEKILLIYGLLIQTIIASSVLIADNTMSKMIELTAKEPFCNVHTDRGNIRTMLLAADASKVRQMSDESIKKLEEVCKNNKVELTQEQGGFIYPGTKWCGPGNKAANYTDFGYYKKEDLCCREHDNCPQSLSTGECRQGICNNSPYTRSHCDCDATFRKCLQNVNSETANTIGAIFFNIIQVICFQERTPCSEWQNNSLVFPTSLNLNCTLLKWINSDKYISSSVSTTSKTSRNFFIRKKHFLFNLLPVIFRKFRLLNNKFS